MCSVVRLACLIHAASVHPEPGSNSQINLRNTNQYEHINSYIRKKFVTRRLELGQLKKTWFNFKFSLLILLKINLINHLLQ